MQVESQTSLREWLDKSQYHGSIKQFSAALGVPLRTAEDWFYRGAKPSLLNKLRVYLATGLEEYAPQGKVEISRLQELEQKEFATLQERIRIFLSLLASLHKELDYFKEAPPKKREVLREHLDGQHIAYISNLLQLLLNEERFREWLTISELSPLATKRGGNR
jgi:hypothetical protein